MTIRICNIKLFLFLSFFISIISSCDDTADCNYNANRKVKLAFAKKTKGVISDTTNNSKLKITSSVGKTIYDTAYVSQIGLPLNQVNDSSMFYLKFDSIAIDTITFISIRKLEMISSNCGFNTRFTIDTILFTKNNIIDIIIVESKIDKDLDMGRNCRLVLKPRTSFN
jgi:hypothetical protein